MKKRELLERLVETLLRDGWVESGQTRTETYRTHSLAYGGGPLIHAGGRRRFTKEGITLTLGLNTICIYRKPEDPETIAGQGRLAGTRVYTFNDWPMKNIEIQRQALEDLPNLVQEINNAGIRISK